ncbi:MAG: bifunctional chorismate mutase/prephenate dehydratase, partial [candidate division Zixibacteria bacterium]|nr:bifunctional chorismate mutase/prephenate dehydratase [candidate division Zixibacteria bacterium]
MSKSDSSGKKSIAFQGEHGAHSEAAARQRFGPDAVTIPCEEFADIYKAVSEGKATHGVVPIENSLVGSIHRNYDLLLEWELPVVGEINYLVSHALLGRKGTSLDSINKVYS